MRVHTWKPLLKNLKRKVNTASIVVVSKKNVTVEDDTDYDDN